MADQSLHPPDAPDVQEHRTEQWIGLLLRTGVIISTAIVIVGGLVYLARHGAEPPALAQFHNEPAMYRSVSGLWRGLLALQGRSIIGIGLLVLVCTPIARVMLTWISFLEQRDWPFVMITTIVLATLFASLLSG